MNTPHDPLRAINEEIQGLSEIRNVLSMKKRVAQEAAAVADQDLNTVLLLIGFADAELERKRAVREDIIRKREEEAK